MTRKFTAAVTAAVLTLSFAGTPAFADEHPYSEGPVVNGSLAAANKGQLDRGSIRRILGSTTMQVLNLK